MHTKEGMSEGQFFPFRRQIAADRFCWIEKVDISMGLAFCSGTQETKNAVIAKQ